MDDRGRNRILRNFDYLTEYTSSIETVCVHLISKGHLSIRELQIVKSQPSDEQKCTELYTILLQKSNNSFEDLLEVLDDTGNEHVSNKLKIPCAEEIREEVFEQQFGTQTKVESSNIEWIAEILCQISYSQWPMLMRRLINQNMAILNELDICAKNKPHSEVVFKTLDYWKSLNGSSATVEVLIKALKASRCNYAADCLRDEVSKRYPPDPTANPSP